jgi:NAD-dependent SIR2 family protein deacetylase
MLIDMSGERPQRESHSPQTPCGCVHCQRLFPYSEIVDFWDEGETPVCPFCGQDTVLVSTPEMIVDAHCLFAARKTYH